MMWVSVGIKLKRGVRKREVRSWTGLWSENRERGVAMRG